MRGMRAAKLISMDDLCSLKAPTNKIKENLSMKHIVLSLVVLAATGCSNSDFDLGYLPCASAQEPACWEGVTFRQVADALDHMPSVKWNTDDLDVAEGSDLEVQISEQLSACVSFEGRAFGTFRIDDKKSLVTVTAHHNVLRACVAPLMANILSRSQQIEVL